MKKYLSVVLILSSLILLFESCSSVRRQGYQRVGGLYKFIPVFGSGFDKAMYRAEITFGDNTFTSLAIVKQIQENNSFKLVFMSEAGMRLFEMEFLEDGSSQVHYMSDFLDKKPIVKKLSADFGLLFLSNPERIDKVYSVEGDSLNYLLRMKINGSKDYYYASTHERPQKIYERGFIYGRTSVFLNQYENGYPAEILFTHKMLKFEIRLNQISYPGWN